MRVFRCAVRKREVVVEGMAEVFNMVWKEGMAPDDWKNAVRVPVYKKGSRLD